MCGPEANQGTGELDEGEMILGGAFPPDPQPPKVVVPAVGSFDDPAPGLYLEWAGESGLAATPNVRSDAPMGSDHAWRAGVQAFVRLDRGCPFCSGFRPSVTNCLAAVDRTLVRQWHPTRNGALTPEDVTPGTDKEVWWKCPKGADHEWRTYGFVRAGAQKRGCPSEASASEYPACQAACEAAVPIPFRVECGARS
jgi:hypothetical protein